MNERFFKYWEGNDYTDEKEPFIELLPCGFPTEEKEIECLASLLLQTQKDMDDLSLDQYPEPIRKQTEIDGSDYWVFRNGFHRMPPKKNVMLNTLSGKNELIQTSSDSDRAWLVSSVVRDSES